MRKKLLTYVIPAIVAGAIAWIALRPRPPQPVEVGDDAPDFSLPLAAAPGGRSVRLADLTVRS